MLDFFGDFKRYLTIGFAMVSTLACPTVGAESVNRVPSAVLRPFVPPVVKPIEITPAPVVIKEVHFIQPIVSKTPVTDSLKAEAAKAEFVKHEQSASIKSDTKPEIKTDSHQFANSELSPVNEELSSIVEGLLGVKYKFGANNPKVALDCSALILRIMEASGKKNLPRTARMLAESSKPVERHNLKAGDLLFFNTRGWDFSHVGMYMGDGRFVHASQQKGKVTFSSLSADYFAKRFTGARRVVH